MTFKACLQLFLKMTVVASAGLGARIMAMAMMATKKSFEANMLIELENGANLRLRFVSHF